MQISKAIANNPPLLFLDEVTSGLDVSVQAKVLDLIRHLQRELGISMIVVSHDLAVIRMLTDRTMVLKHGRIVEAGLTDQILQDPQHSYTQHLIAAVPATLVPIRLPWMKHGRNPKCWTPYWPLPEMTLPAPATVPPIVCAVPP